MAVSVQDSIDRGWLRPDGDAAAILREVEKTFAVSPPQNPVDAFDLLDRAARTVNPQYSGGIPINPQGIVMGQDNVILNAGGIRTTLRANGEVLVEDAQGRVLLHLEHATP